LASLYRLDVIVKGNSTITQDGAVEFTKNWVNNRQEASNNIDENGNYIKEFYADLYDSRTNKAWKVFSDVAAKNKRISNNYVKNDGTIIRGVIYTLPFWELIEALEIRIAFLEAQLQDVETQEDKEIKILV